MTRPTAIVTRKLISSSILRGSLPPSAINLTDRRFPESFAAIKLGPYAAIAVGEPPRHSRQPDADAACGASRAENFGRVKLTSDRELMSLASVTDGSKR